MNLSLPSWVASWLGEELVQSHANGASWVADVSEGERFRVISLCIADAAELDDEQLAVACRDAYLGIRDILGSYSMVRVWNGVPGILDEASNLRDRYMVFNAGRCAAFDAWFGAREADAFAAAMPAATGVGHASGDLSIHVLADKQPGVAVENPRQQSAFRYSRRYGPQPPCFSRATRLVGPAANNEEYVLLSGTASIVGEESTHVGDLALQFDETLANLDALILAAGGQGVHGMRDIRIYHTDEVSVTELETLVANSRIASVPAIEFYPAVLCRESLQVEIEGLAVLS